jgi:hypothetical protein
MGLITDILKELIHKYKEDCGQNYHIETITEYDEYYEFSLSYEKDDSGLMMEEHVTIPKDTIMEIYRDRAIGNILDDCN